MFLVVINDVEEQRYFFAIMAKLACCISDNKGLFNRLTHYLIPALAKCFKLIQI